MKFQLNGGPFDIGLHANDTIRGGYEISFSNLIKPPPPNIACWQIINIYPYPCDPAAPRPLNVPILVFIARSFYRSGLSIEANGLFILLLCWIRYKLLCCNVKMLHYDVQEIKYLKFFSLFPNDSTYAFQNVHLLKVAI